MWNSGASTKNNCTAISPQQKITKFQQEPQNNTEKIVVLWGFNFPFDALWGKKDWTWATFEMQTNNSLSPYGFFLGNKRPYKNFLLGFISSWTRYWSYTNFDSVYLTNLNRIALDWGQWRAGDQSYHQWVEYNYSFSSQWAAVNAQVNLLHGMPIIFTFCFAFRVLRWVKAVK